MKPSEADLTFLRSLRYHAIEEDHVPEEVAAALRRILAGCAARPASEQVYPLLEIFLQGTGEYPGVPPAVTTPDAGAGGVYWLRRAQDTLARFPPRMLREFLRRALHEPRLVLRVRALGVPCGDPELLPDYLGCLRRRDYLGERLLALDRLEGLQAHGDADDLSGIPLQPGSEDFSARVQALAAGWRRAEHGAPDVPRDPEARLDEENRRFLASLRPRRLEEHLFQNPQDRDRIQVVLFLCEKYPEASLVRPLLEIFGQGGPGQGGMPYQDYGAGTMDAMNGFGMGLNTGDGCLREAQRILAGYPPELLWPELHKLWRGDDDVLRVRALGVPAANPALLEDYLECFRRNQCVVTRWVVLGRLEALGDVVTLAQWRELASFDGDIRMRLRLRGILERRGA